MSLRLGSMVIPVETVRVARAVFPQGCLVMRTRDVLGPIFDDAEFAALFPRRGQPALSPGRLALVSVLQFAEGLTDRQAAHAVRSRLDWKFCLGLDLDDQGFDYSVLSEFRTRLVDGGQELRLLDAVLEAARAAGLLTAGGRQRTDSTHVLAATRDLTRLEMVSETLRAALNAVAAVAGDWLVDHVEPEWFPRYSTRAEDTRLPTRWAARRTHGEQVGADGITLLRAIYAPGTPTWLAEVPAVDLLRQMWVQQYQIVDERVILRDKKNLPPGMLRLTNPYDSQSRAGMKRDLGWDGYAVHLTETCEPDAPHLIINVATTVAPVADMVMSPPIHDNLNRRGFLPDIHLVDAGYVSAHAIVQAKLDYGVTLFGPTKADSTRQGSNGKGFGQEAFTIDWDHQSVTCPDGKLSKKWSPATNQRGKPVIRVAFSPTDCRTCPVQPSCMPTTNKKFYRSLTLRPHADHDALQAARAAEKEPGWRSQYRLRAGVESTISQACRTFGLRRSRYRGFAKTSLQHLLTAAGINLVRLDAWLTETPLGPTRISHFAALRPAG